MRIDAHQHFFDYHQHNEDYGWMSNEHAILKKDFLPTDLLPELQQANLNGSIVVQARQNLRETQWLLDLANQYPWIYGVVGWVDLCANNVAEQLEKFTIDPKLRGIRHIIHDEPDDHFMLRDDFQHGISSLQQYDLAYDLLLFPKHLSIAETLVKNFPQQRFVIDHIAKPPIKAQQFEPWKTEIQKLADYANVYCKVSGMVTEADLKNWHAADFNDYLDAVYHAFGEDRLLYGSDWPVCLLAANYQQQYEILDNYMQQYPATTQQKFFGKNAATFYHLEV